MNPCFAHRATAALAAALLALGAGLAGCDRGANELTPAAPTEGRTVPASPPELAPPAGPASAASQ